MLRIVLYYYIWHILLGHNCVEILSDGNWNDDLCQVKKAFICQTPDPDETATNVNNDPNHLLY